MDGRVGGRMRRLNDTLRQKGPPVVATFRFLSLLLTAVNSGLLLAHAVEMPGKMTLAGQDYLVVQQIYRWRRPVGAVTEPAALLATGALAVLVRDDVAAFGLTSGALVALVAALVIFFAVTQPVNARLPKLDPANPEPDWVRLRDRWEWSHAMRAVLSVLALIALIFAV